MDTDEGIPEDPLSLHKYLYVNSDPVNQVDPSGNVPVFGDQEFGYAVEAEVEPQYAADHLIYMTPFSAQPRSGFFTESGAVSAVGS